MGEETEPLHGPLPLRGGPPAGSPASSSSSTPDAEARPGSVGFGKVAPSSGPGPCGEEDGNDGRPGARTGGGTAEEAEHLLAPAIRPVELLERAPGVSLEAGHLVGEPSRPAEEKGDRLARVEILCEHGVEAFHEVLHFVAQRLGEVLAGPFGAVPLQDLRDPVGHERQPRVRLPRFLEALTRLEGERAPIVSVQVVEAQGTGADAVDRVVQGTTLPIDFDIFSSSIKRSPPCIQ